MSKKKISVSKKKPKPEAKPKAKRKPRRALVPVKIRPKVIVPTVRDPEALIAQAVNRKLPVETIGKLLDLRDRLKAEWTRDQYFKALARFQRECPPIPKRKKVFNKKQPNEKIASVRFRYAPFEDIDRITRAAREENGFSFTMKTASAEMEVLAKESGQMRKVHAIKSTCVIHHEAGHSEESEFTAPVDFESYMNDPQRVHSASSFSQRVAFCSGFGIVPVDEDDGGEAAGVASGGDAGIDVQRAEQEKVDSVGINTKFDQVLSKLRAGVFKDQQRFAMENRLTALHKAGNMAGMLSFERDVDRQIAYAAKKPAEQKK